MNQEIVAYFSMEIGLESGIPTYSGGLGVLAGDTLRSAADLNVPMAGVTLLTRKGYFDQRLDSRGNQTENSCEWDVEEHLQEMKPRVSLELEGRTVYVRAWKYTIKGIRGHRVPVYLLDTDLKENDERDRGITHTLYGGDAQYRLRQEAVLGIAGVRMLKALGYFHIRRFHMNEGHSSLLTLELLENQARAAGRPIFNESDAEAVRHLCVFTTHTPVAAGHDRFPLDMAQHILGWSEITERPDIFCEQGMLDMTHTALNLSGFVNGVAKKHRDVSREMFGRPNIEAVSNGVHAATWTCGDFQEIFNRHFPDWRQDNASLRHALSIPKEEIFRAHSAAKRRLLEAVSSSAGVEMDEKAFTIGFARRATSYKRADLLLDNPEELLRIASSVGPVQVVYAGKAHPKDSPGKELIRKIFDAKDRLNQRVRIVYLENYAMDLAKLLVSGVDLWLNTPEPPMEASGTSGMKAALNAIPSLSTADGWWLEGCIEGVTGWRIGDGRSGDRAGDARSLYQKLGENILPLYYRKPDAYLDVMRQSIALNGSFFNSHRMVRQYVLEAYYRNGAPVPAAVSL